MNNSHLFVAKGTKGSSSTASARGRNIRVRFNPGRIPTSVSVPIVVAIGIYLWDGLVRWRDLPAFILPGPKQVLERGLQMGAEGLLWRHLQATLIEIIVGMAIGLTVGLVLGYLLAKNSTLDRLLSPYIVASQTIPIVAIAPLIVIWLGNGLLSKVLITSLIVFFPLLVSTAVGIRSVEPALRELMRSLRATRWQVFHKLELPAALPEIFGGLRLGVVLAVVGAVVGEFVGADVGLGFLINLGRGILDTSMIFVAVFLLVALAQFLYAMVILSERLCLGERAGRIKSS